jgi:hypothetical protein
MKSKHQQKSKEATSSCDESMSSCDESMSSMKELHPSTLTIKDCPLAAAQALMALSVMRPLKTESNGEEPTAVRDAVFESTAETLFKPSWSLTPADRLEIYNKQYWFRILDSMLEDFPGVHALLGAEKFDALIYAYVSVHPSTTHTLRDLGAKLPEFVLQHPEIAGKDSKMCHQMCLFEWAAIEAFDRKRYPTIPANAVASGNPDALVLVLQPFISLFETDYALDDFAIDLDKHSAQHGISTAQAGRDQKKKKTKRPKKEHAYLVIHRQKNGVYYKRVDQEQFKLLQLIKSGATLGHACASLASELSPENLSTFPARLRKNFAEWMDLSWFADPTAMPKSAHIV